MHHRSVLVVKTNSATSNTAATADNASPLNYATPQAFSHRPRTFNPWLYTVCFLSTCAFVAWLMTPTFSHGDARPAAAQTGLSTLDTALSQFRSDTGRYPTAGEDLTALLTAPASITDWHGPYIQHPPIDPWEHPYVYRTFLRHGVWKYELFSAGPDGQPGTGDDISTRIDP